MGTHTGFMYTHDLLFIYVFETNILYMYIIYSVLPSRTLFFEQFEWHLYLNTNSRPKTRSIE